MVQHEKLTDRLIVALDVSSLTEALFLVETLGESVSFYKVGLGLQCAGGERVVEELIKRGKRVFLDYKYYDIDRTVENAVRAVSLTGVDFLTIHGTGSVIRAAVRGRIGSRLKLLAVTVLTSMETDDLVEMGYPCTVEELVRSRVALAASTGCDGIVASAREARWIKENFPHLIVVTPGIRNEPTRDEQKRTATVGEAISAGADHLVVGRPIIESDDPKLVAQRITEIINIS